MSVSPRAALLGGAAVLAAGAASTVLFPNPAARAQGAPPARAVKVRPAPLPAITAPVTVTVDAAADRHAINPFVYGVAYADDAQLADLKVPLHRSGGNNTSRYNWNLDADNRANDYFFQSIGDNEGNANQPAGKRGDDFIQRSKAVGAQPMLTLPMVGWVAKLGPNRTKLWSYSKAKYGAQTRYEFWNPDSGNGVSAATGQEITTNDPNDANVPADATFQKPWIQHLVTKWGTAANGGLRYYLYDNESSIWHSTHRDVHPVGARNTEIRDKIIAYGDMIRSVDPSAKLVGPEEWGWSGYQYSGYDQQWLPAHNYSWPPPDRSTQGMDYLPWLLKELKAKEGATGAHYIDAFTVHFYPQGGEFSDDVTNAVQLKRNQTTRSLWDPAYTDPTWINDKVQLIPRLKSWVKTYYWSETPVGITEYNWGAEGHMNGATAQADIWGIFGRENLDMGARWTTPATGTPAYLAMKLYRNYDGAGSGFGETSVRATSNQNADELAVFASRRASDGALTVVLVNKTLPGASAAVTTVNLSNFTPGTAAQVWRVAAGTGGPTTATLARQADATVTAGSPATVSVTLPAQTVTLLVVPPAPPALVRAPSLTLGDFGGDCTKLTAALELRTPGTTTVVARPTATVLAPGAVEFTAPAAGTYDVALKLGTHLRKRWGGVTVTAGGTVTLSAASLVNGDASGDNTVSITDAAKVSAALGTRPGDTKWNASADLDGDGVVTSKDYNIVVNNLYKQGDQ
jgi:hypothetical protein